ncbi:hypothetical protein BH09CHL1_BH09CHL1_07730 [soil metagenome]
MIHPIVSFDATADALYIEFEETEVVRTIELSASVYLDLDADGRPVGLEVLNSTGPLRDAFHDASAVASMQDLLLSVR